MTHKKAKILVVFIGKTKHQKKLRELHAYISNNNPYFTFDVIFSTWEDQKVHEIKNVNVVDVIYNEREEFHRNILSSPHFHLLQKYFQITGCIPDEENITKKIDRLMSQFYCFSQVIPYLNDKEYDFILKTRTDLQTDSTIFNFDHTQMKWLSELYDTFVSKGFLNNIDSSYNWYSHMINNSNMPFGMAKLICCHRKFGMCHDNFVVFSGNFFTKMTIDSYLEKIFKIIYNISLQNYIRPEGEVIWFDFIKNNGNFIDGVDFPKIKEESKAVCTSNKLI